MKILHVVQSLDLAWGGIARVLPELAGGLAKAGDLCRIATLAGGRYGTPPDVAGVEVLRFAAPDSSRLARSAEFDRAIPDLVRQADVIHLHGLWTAQNRSAGKAARSAGKPYIMTPHCMMTAWAWQRSRWKKRPIGWWFEHRNLREAACLHALADGEAADMRGLGFNPRVEVIPNGLHTADYADPPPPDSLIARFPVLENKQWLLILGRIAEQKGIIPAMQACFDVAATGGQWHLVVAGPDEFGIRTHLQAAINRKGLTDRVTFTGLLPQDEVRACLGASSLLLQPSLAEGLSMSILEAMASGLPVIISPACNLPEVAQVDAGRVIQPHRHAVSKALRELLDMTDADRQALGERGRLLAREQFDWSILIPRYQRMYAAQAKA